MIAVFKRDGIWPPIVPSVVLVEIAHRTSTSRRSDQSLPQDLRHRGGRATAPRPTGSDAATSARRGSAVDAIVVAMAEPAGTVLSGDVGDLRALATYAQDVEVHRV